MKATNNDNQKETYKIEKIETYSKELKNDKKHIILGSIGVAAGIIALILGKDKIIKYIEVCSTNSIKDSSRLSEAILPYAIPAVVFEIFGLTILGYGTISYFKDKRKLDENKENLEVIRKR